ncbi:flagellar biosynthesis protein FlhB [Pleionea sp. CnH1-48]|uniref:EscU/YscU/HrcU family type III secretion system export apparatus switch protein n=1 Tax=Pleionea sp. CnH1-48 TaxID=2954494 RepID=UPI002097C28B|nr:EscU/YscU/HrcU family type III secretion system export apparatus switch protein [Pleionea sp. CnH1-48]MCO7223723.1 EscU/YscU/HrcU family type III secretion system export apparatus switch protein [Pleionea sp. CnH1-48]
MAQDDFDKSEEATPQKLKDARKKGQVAKSQEVSHWIVLSSFLVISLAFWLDLSREFGDFFRTIILAGTQIDMSTHGVLSWFSLLSEDLMQMFGAPVLFLMLAGILANVLQTKPLISSHPIKPDFNRLNPAQGAKKLFNRKVLFELLKVTLKLLAFGLLVFLVLSYFLPDIFIIAYSERDQMGSDIVHSIARYCGVLMLILLPVALLDWLFSVKDFARNMRMSRKEVKDEHKRHDGNPEIKSKRKEIQRELVKKSSSLGQVKNADVIVTNPSHYAIALKYDQSKMAVPIVLAKGKDTLAAQIRQLARMYSKPILRRPLLARELYRSCNINEPVMVDNYESVAEVYRWLYQLQGKL